MLKILVIECLLSCVLGAIAFRLAWAFSSSKAVAWGVALLLAAAVLLLLPGEMDEWLIRDYGGNPFHALDVSPFAVNLLRALSLLAGAWLASLAVRRRVKLGLNENPPRYKDFP